MLTLIVTSVLFLLVAIAIVIGVMITWALSESHEHEVDTKQPANANKLRGFFKRFWSWANAVPPKLEYRRDKKGRFRKLKRW